MGGGTNGSQGYVLNRVGIVGDKCTILNDFLRYKSFLVVVKLKKSKNFKPGNPNPALMKP